MYFLARDEADEAEKKLRRQLADQPRARLVLYRGDRQHDSGVAHAVTVAMGAYTEAIMLFISTPFGDGWSENDLKNDGNDRARYRKWRHRHGDRRRLNDAPGHRFGAGEADALTSVIAFAFEIGSDALLAAMPGRQLMVLSHDDRIEIYRGFDWRVL